MAPTQGTPIKRPAKEGYQQLNLIGTPSHAVEVDDSVWLSENKLLNGAYMAPNFKRQPYVPQDHEWTSKLNLYTGRNLKPLLDRPEKKENPPLFKPFKYDYIANYNDVMNKTLAMASRFRDDTSPISRNFEKPTPEIKVAPGVDIGYNAEPTGRPFHPWYRTPEYNIDELRGEVRPTFYLQRTSIGVKGDKGYRMVKATNPKRRPEDIYGQGNQARVVPGIGTFSKGLADKGNYFEGFIKKFVKRGDSVEHFGPADRGYENRELPDNMKPYTEPLRLNNQPDRVTRVGNPYMDHEDPAYDRTMHIKPKMSKKMQFNHIVVDRQGNPKPVRYKTLDPKHQGHPTGRDLLNKDLAVGAVRQGGVNTRNIKSPYTNKDTLLMKMPSEYDYDRDNAPDALDWQGMQIRDGIMVGDADDNTEHLRDPTVDVVYTASKPHHEKSFRFMKLPKQGELQDDYHQIDAPNTRGPNRNAHQKIRDSHVDNIDGNINRVGINYAQSSHQLTRAHAKDTNRELYAGTERYAGGGSALGRDYRDTTTTKLNNKRPVTVYRQPNGAHYANYSNQKMGLTQTNVNRSAKKQQPIPYPLYPSMGHFGYNNQIIMGANTRDTRPGMILSQVDYRPTSLIKPIMTFK